MKTLFLKKTYLLNNVITVCILAMSLSSCNSRMPAGIRGDLDNAPSVAQVHTQADKFISQKVRWGGKILNIENKQNTSRLTIVAFPLNSYGRPKNTDQSPGRFIAVINQFLEPELYSRDREITITGSLLKSETLKVGEFDYSHPTVQVDNHYLWAIEQKSSNNNYMHHWWHDSWYNPYYPHPYPHHLHTY